MKKWLVLEKVMWGILACLFIVAFPFCYWAATPDELIIISEPAETEEKETVEATKARIVTLSEPYKETVTEAETEPIETASETEATTETETISTTEAVTVETVQAKSDTVYLGTYLLSAYCPCSYCCGKSDGVTATGTQATQGRTIAVDPSVIPYGSQVIINGHTYTAEDCGGAINGNRIDVFFNSHAEALVFGMQYADVYLCT